MNRFYLRQQRLSAGMSLQDVAARLLISPSTLQRYEKGVFKKIPLDIFFGLADVYDVPLEEMMMASGSQPPTPAHISRYYASLSTKDRFIFSAMMARRFPQLLVPKKEDSRTERG